MWVGPESRLPDRSAVDDNEFGAWLGRASLIAAGSSGGYESGTLNFWHCSMNSDGFYSEHPMLREASLQMTTDPRPPHATGDMSALEAELAFLLKHAGLDVPADRKAGLVTMYGDLKQMIGMLRNSRTAASEPSNIYILDSITREP